MTGFTGGGGKISKTLWPSTYYCPNQGLDLWYLYVPIAQGYRFEYFHNENGRRACLSKEKGAIAANQNTNCVTEWNLPCDFRRTGRYTVQKIVGSGTYPDEKLQFYKPIQPS